MAICCGSCSSVDSVYHSRDRELLCRPCWASQFGSQPPPANLVLRAPRHWEDSDFRDPDEEGILSKDDPWEDPWPSLHQFVAKETTRHDIAQFEDLLLRATADSQVSPEMQVAICGAALACERHLHCEHIAKVSGVVASSNGTLPEVCRDALQRFLDALSKHAQPCHFSGYVAPAYELQVFGLAHGSQHVVAKATAAAIHIRQTRDASAAAEQLWIFLTAKAPEKVLFLAAHEVDVDKGSIDAIAALVCAFSQVPADWINDDFALQLVGEIECSAHKLPTPSIARVAFALATLSRAAPDEHSIPGSTSRAAAPPTQHTIRDSVFSTIGALCKEALGRGLGSFFSEDLVDLAVARSAGHQAQSKNWNDQFVSAVAGELIARHDIAPGCKIEQQILTPGCKVQLRKCVGSVSAGSCGLLGEFVLATGRWRVWLSSGLSVDVRCEELGLMDRGHRPAACCDECWRLSSELWKADAGGVYCRECWQSWTSTGHLAGDLVDVPSIVTGVRGTRDDSLDGDSLVSCRNVARLCCALARSTMRSEFSNTFHKLVAMTTSLRHNSSWVTPFRGDYALADDQQAAARSRTLPELPVLVINLDRSPQRLECMKTELQKSGVCARRFPAIDGRHRVVRRSAAKPYTHDLTDFALRWDESRPALGVALTAHQERHYVGYVGSWLSHARAVRQGMEEGFAFVSVMEDDQVISPDFNAVVQNIIECAGHELDTVILGPLDWRLRSLRYAQRRKVMQLQVPCRSPACTEEDDHMTKLYGFHPELLQEQTYFLYSIGSKAMGGDDYMSTGCCGVWAYLVSRSGNQKMQGSMKFMWESFDDVLQAEMQGNCRFTSTNGRRRLWAVWPPIVTSDGKWPSQNSGEDLDMGRQVIPVSPHASFRDPSLRSSLASVVLGPHHAYLNGGSTTHNDLVLRLAATTALLLPPVEPVWAYVVSGWRRLFDQRHGSGNGFELRTEMQLRLHTDQRFFEIVTEGTTWSWTLLRAAYLRGFVKLAVGYCSPCNPPEGPPVTILPLHVRIVAGPLDQLNWCPDAWFQDLCVAAPGSRITFAGEAGRTLAEVGPNGSESSRQQSLLSQIRRELPLVTSVPVDVSAVPSFQTGEVQHNPTIVFAAGVELLTASLLADLYEGLITGSLVLITSRTFGTSLDVLNELNARLKCDRSVIDSKKLNTVCVGANPFASCLALGRINHDACPSPGCRGRLGRLVKQPKLNGQEVLVVRSNPDTGRWIVRLASGEERQVKPENIEVELGQRWPPAPVPPLRSEELWGAARAHCRGEFYGERAEDVALACKTTTNAYWLGVYLDFDSP